MFLSLFCERHSGRVWCCVCCVYAELAFKIFAHSANPFRCRIFLFRLCLVVAPGAFWSAQCLRHHSFPSALHAFSSMLSCCSFPVRTFCSSHLFDSFAFSFSTFPPWPQVRRSSDAVRFVTDDAEPFIDGALLFGFVCFVFLADVCPRSWQEWPRSAMLGKRKLLGRTHSQSMLDNRELFGRQTQSVSVGIAVAAIEHERALQMNSCGLWAGSELRRLCIQSKCGWSVALFWSDVPLRAILFFG